MNNFKILLIGESNRDFFIYGSTRQSPESPSLVIHPKYETTNPGMAANVKANLESLDPDIEITFITNSEQITKTRYVDENSGSILLRVDENDKASPLTKHQWQTIKDIKKYNAIVISSYNKGLLSILDIEDIAQLTHKHKIPLFVDCKFILNNWSKKIDFVKINNKEYQENLYHIKQPERFCKHLIVSEGSNGAMLYQWKKEPKHFAAQKVEVSCVAGCGDVMLSSIVIKYLQTKNIEETIKFANKAAGIAATKRGVIAIKASEIV